MAGHFVNTDALGASIGILWTNKARWMHRRVDTVEFCDAITMSFRVIIDMTIPHRAISPLIEGSPLVGVTGTHGRPVALVPISLINKKQTPSMAFSLTDEEGRELSRLRSAEAGELGAISLALMADRILSIGNHQISDADRFRALLSTLCRPGSVADGRTAWRRLLAKPHGDWGMTADAKKLLSADYEFSQWAHLLAEHYFLCVLLEGHPGQQCIIRFSFESNLGDASERPLTARLGLSDSEYVIPASAAGDCASYHCEIIHPSGIDVNEIEMFEDDIRLSPVALRQGANELRSHVVAAGARDPFGKYFLVVRLRVKWHGWLRAAALLGYGISFLMILSGFLFEASGGGGKGVSADAGTLVGALLLGTGAACITVLVRVNEHQLTAYLLQYFRILMSCLVALAFLVVLVLAFADVAVLKVVFFIAGGAAFAGATVLALPGLQHVYSHARDVMLSFWEG